MQKVKPYGDLKLPRNDAFFKENVRRLMPDRQAFLQRVDTVFEKYKKYDDQAREVARAWAARNDDDGEDSGDDDIAKGPRKYFLRGMRKAHSRVRELIIGGRVGDPPNYDMYFYKGAVVIVVGCWLSAVYSLCLDREGDVNGLPTYLTCRGTSQLESYWRSVTTPRRAIVVLRCDIVMAGRKRRFSQARTRLV